MHIHYPIHKLTTLKIADIQFQQVHPEIVNNTSNSQQGYPWYDLLTSVTNNTTLLHQSLMMKITEF